jgi:DNA-binding NarL/FixJ family response regulator
LTNRLATMRAGTPEVGYLPAAKRRGGGNSCPRSQFAAQMRAYGVAMAASDTRSGAPVRLVLVDDHEMVIEGLKAMLAAFKDRVQVVGQAVGAERAVSVIDDLQPDVVLCDVRMQGSSGLDLCRTLRERDPERKIVMLSVYDDEQYLFQALRVGARGYLLKSINSDELVRQLELAHRGETVIDPGMAARAADTAARMQRDEFWPGARQGLTQRESEILSCMVNGLSNRGIANKLIIGEETVKSHLRSIYRKLGVSDRTGAVATALREGIYH